MPGTTSPPKRTRQVGRPRNPAVDVVVLQATVEILGEVGYGGLTIDAVARRAKTNKPTIYRRWPSKAHLVHEAAFPITDLDLIPNSDDFAADVRQMVAGAIELFRNAAVRSALPGLLDEFFADPDLHRALLERFETVVWRRFRERIATAIATGEVRPDVDADVLIDAISGAAFLALTLRTPSLVGDRWIDSLTDVLLKGIAAP